MFVILALLQTTTIAVVGVVGVAVVVFHRPMYKRVQTPERLIGVSSFSESFLFSS